MRRFKQCGNDTEAEACSSIPNLAGTVAQESAEDRGSRLWSFVQSLWTSHNPDSGCRGSACMQGLVNETV